MRLSLFEVFFLHSPYRHKCKQKNRLIHRQNRHFRSTLSVDSVTDRDAPRRLGFIAFAVWLCDRRNGEDARIPMV